MRIKKLIKQTNEVLKNIKLKPRNVPIFIFLTLFLTFLGALWTINSYSVAVFLLIPAIFSFWVIEFPSVRKILKLSEEKSQVLKISVCLLTLTQLYEMVQSRVSEFYTTGNSIYFFDENERLISIDTIIDSSMPSTMSLYHTNLSYFSLNNIYRSKQFIKTDNVITKNDINRFFISSVAGQGYSQSPFTNVGNPILINNREYSIDDKYQITDDMHEGSYYSRYLDEGIRFFPIPKYKKFVSLHNKIEFYGTCTTTFVAYFEKSFNDTPSTNLQTHFSLMYKLEKKLNKKIIPYDFNYSISLKCPWYYAFSPELKSYSEWFEKIDLYTKRQFDWFNINEAIVKSSEKWP